MKVGDRIPIATGSFQSGVGVGAAGTGGLVNPLDATPDSSPTRSDNRGGFPNRRRAQRLLCIKSACDRLLHSEELFTRLIDSTPAWRGRRSLPLGLIVNADSMLLRNPASLGIENQRTKCVKMFRSNYIDFSPTKT